MVVLGAVLTEAELVAVARGGEAVELSPEALEAVARARRHVEAMAAGDVPVYGVSTGFGALATRHVPVERRAQLQRSLIRSHAAGSGPEVEREVVRGLALLRLRTLATGRTGVRVGTAQALCGLLNAGITPVVREFGSLGCSGDLAPLAHVALALMGEGTVRDASGELVDAAAALAAAGLAPVELAEKEGLALVNGTDGMLAHLLLACADLDELLRLADLTAAMSLEALLGTDRVLAEDLMALRPQPGQAVAASNMRRLLDGSAIVASHRGPQDARVQDAYSVRCAPQVAGAARDTLAHARAVAAREAASCIDNPVLLPDGRLESNGNFHGAPVGYVLDFLAIAAADVASISERRTDRLLDAKRSHGLPPFLADDPGVDSGLMIAQYTQAGLVSELKRLAVPASVDSIPSSAMQEDHVSMGWSAARKLRRSLDGLRRVLAVELMTAARALDLRAPLQPAPATAAAVAALRAHVEGPGPDRVLSDEIEASVAAASAAAGGGRGRDRRARLMECRSWQTEAALRCLRNNLHPDVAERPEDLVVYGGNGKAARDRASLEAIERTLVRLAVDETLLVQSGKPVGVFRTFEHAPRVLLANSLLVPGWATWQHFWEHEALGLTMYGQMTAGSWIYIGTQGIVQGTFQTFAALAEQRYDGTLRGKVVLTAGLGGMGGAQPLAVTLNGGVALCVEVDRVAAAASARDALPRRAGRLPRRRAAPGARRRRRGPGAVGRASSRTPPRRCPSCSRAASSSTSSPTRPARTTRCTGTSRPGCRCRTRTSCAARSRASTWTGRAPRWSSTAARWSASPAPARRCSTTATTCAARPGRRGSPRPSSTRASCRPTSGRCSAPASGRSASSRCPATRRTSRSPTRRCWPPSRTTRSCSAGSRWRASGSRSRGCRRASAGSATASARRRDGCSTTSSRPVASARRSSSAATTWTAGRSRRRTARPRRWPTAPTRSPTGRSSTRC